MVERLPKDPTVISKPAVAMMSPSVDSAVARKTEKGISEGFHSILLQSPNGKWWRITVSDVGVVQTTEMTR